MHISSLTSCEEEAGSESTLTDCRPLLMAVTLAESEAEVPPLLVVARVEGYSVLASVAAPQSGGPASKHQQGLIDPSCNGE